MTIDILQISDTEYVVVNDPGGVTTYIESNQQGPQGIAGPQGPSGVSSIIKTSAAALSGHRVVLADSTGKVNYASNVTLSHANKAIGITTGAAGANSDTTIQSYGDMVEPTWNWTPDVPVYLGIDGNLTQVPPVAPAAKFSLVVGFPTTPTTLFIKIGFPIILT